MGMAITVSCNTILVSLFNYVDGISLFISIGVAGLCMIVIVLCFTELASKFPGAIGIRAFTKAAFGNKFSLAATLFYVLMVILLGGLEIFLCHLLLQQLFSPILAVIALCLLIFGILAVNLTGYDLSLRLQIAMTLIVIGMMIWLSMMAFNNQSSFLPVHIVSANIIESVPRALFLFVGVEWAIMHATHHLSFRKKLPVALIISIVAIAFLYSIFGAALQSRFAANELSSIQLPHLELARILHTQVAIWLVTLISLLAVLTSFNVGLSGSARILYSLAREQEIPAWFAVIQGSNLAPRNAMLFIAGSVLIASLLMATPDLGDYISLLFGFHISLIYALVLLAWLQMRRKKDLRGIKQPVHAFVVWPTLIFLFATSFGVLFQDSNYLLKLTLISETAFIFIISLYLNRFSAIKT